LRNQKSVLYFKMIKQRMLILLVTTAVNFCFFNFCSIPATFASDGLVFENKQLHPGKADFHYLHTKTTEEYNFILWSPSFKGGAGVIDSDTASPTNYSGGYFRPLLPKDGNGELIFWISSS